MNTKEIDTIEKNEGNNIPTTNEDEKKQEMKQAKKQAKKEQKQMRRLRRKERLLRRPPPTTFPGKHKWLGGAVDPNTGKIYGIPSHSYQVICITPAKTDDNTDEKAKISTIPLPNQYKEGKYKWLRGLIHNNFLYGIPAWNANGVLKVSLESQKHKVKILPLPPLDGGDEEEKCVILENEDRHKQNDHEHADRERKFNSIDRNRWMWHGGAIGNGPYGSAIYCVPSNAKRVLKVSLENDAVEEIGPTLQKGLQNKWYGGIVGRDGCIYGMPYTATGVLQIDPRTDTVRILGNYPEGGYKWHGGLLAHSTGVIYAFPAHSNEVLYVDTNTKECSNSGLENDDQSWRVSTIPIQRNEEDSDPHDLRYKWLGGSYGADGCIYGMPSDATSILRIDPLTNQATTFGKVSNTINKWQGGVLSRVDNCVYAVPADMNCVLRIDTDPDTPLNIDLVGEGFKDVEDKWQV